MTASNREAAAERQRLESAKERRRRVSVLAAIRIWGVDVYAATLAVWWSNLAEFGGHLWHGLSHVPGVTRTMTPLNVLLRQIAPGIAAPIDGVLFGVLAAASTAVIFYVIYNLGFSSLWRRWDERARAAWLFPDPQGHQPNPVAWPLWMLVWVLALAVVSPAMGAVIGLEVGPLVLPVVLAVMVLVVAAVATVIIVAHGRSRQSRREPIVTIVAGRDPGGLILPSCGQSLSNLYCTPRSSMTASCDHDEEG